MLLRINFSLKIIYVIIFYGLSQITSEATAYSKLLDVTDKTNPVATCVLKILQKYVNCSEVIEIVAYNRHDVHGLIRTINEDLCYSVAILKLNDEGHSHGSRDAYVHFTTMIVLIEIAEDLSEILSQLAYDIYWNPRARFIIHLNKINEDKTNEIFDVLVKNYIYDAVVLSNIENDVEIHSYDAFKQGKCGRHFKNMILGKCDKALQSSILFTTRRVANTRNNNCSVKVLIHTSSTYFERSIPALEKYMLDNVALQGNLALKYEISKIHGNQYGLVFPNGTRTGMFALLQEGSVDVALGGLMLTKSRADGFEYVWGYNYGTLSLFTPVLDKLGWKNIFKLMGPTSWILTTLCFCLVTSISILVATVYPEIAQERLMLIFKLWGFFFQGNSDTGLLKIKRLRLLLCCWIWFTFLISNFYSSVMFSMVTAQVVIKRHIHIEDLGNLPFKPCISNNVRNMFLSAFTQHLPESDECQLNADTMSMVSSRDDMYTISIKQSYLLRENDFINSRGKKTIEAWDFSNPYITVVYFRKGYYLKAVIEKYAIFMFEAGLMQKYFDNMCLSSRSAILKKSKSFVQVQLRDLRTHFFALGVGVLISTTVFLFEVTVNFFQNRLYNEIVIF